MKFFIAAFIAMAAIGGVNYYLAKRCSQWFSSVFPKCSAGLCFLIFVALTMLMILGFVRSLLPIPTTLKHILAAISSYCMGFYAYLLMYTILADIILFFCRLTKAVSPATPSLRLISGITVMVLTLVTVGYGIWHAQQIKTVSYHIDIQEKVLDDDWNIVMISDLHLGAVSSEKRLSKIVKKINDLEPDLICIAGDFFDNDYAAIKNPAQAMQTLKQLKSEHGVYVCLGNHDSGSTFLQMQQFLNDCGIRVLNDTYVTIQEELILVGRLDFSPIGGYGNNLFRKEPVEILPQESTDCTVIILDHNPENIDEYTNEADLILSGHTHKGQIFPGNLFTKRMYTVDYGYYRKDTNSPHVIVSSGVGTWGMPMRIGTDCEIVQITLH